MSRPSSPPKFVPRVDWGSSGRVATPQNHPIGDVYGITAHWEGPGMGGFPHSKCAGKVRVIERFHKYTRGWADIAYSALVCPHGYIFEGRGPNVMTAANGVSSIGGNDHWYAVCYLGGQGDPFTDDAKAGFVAAFEWLRDQGGAGQKLNGHRDHHATECPGDVIYQWVHGLDPARIGQEIDDMDVMDFMRHPINKDGMTVADALRDAHQANERSQQIERAVGELGKALDKVAPGVAAAVQDALAEAVVDVDVDVHKPRTS